MKTRRIPALLLPALALLAGCLGAPTPSPTLHSLAPLALSAPLPAPAPDAPPLYLPPDEIPRHHDRPHIAVVSPDDPDILLPLDRDRWTAPLADAIADTLWPALAAALPGYAVQPLPTRTPPTHAATLRIAILRFEGPLAGPVTLLADCTLAPRDGKPIHWLAHLSATPGEASLPAYVRTLRGLVGELPGTIPKEP
ncbi:MAG: membrane integrity-associated transporter subunit PqiC [Kiritimatiellae bacterium]|nr:membrane integrity-associated transporter subunit PqiC [Kiritimatiellia bacterium]